MRVVTLAMFACALLLTVPRAEAQQFGGGGGQFGAGGGAGGGGFVGGQTGQNVSTQQGRIQSAGPLSYIIGRSTQGTFGARALGSATRQRVRGFMGSSQTGGFGSQYSTSGAYRNTRAQLPGSGAGTFSSYS